MKYLKQIGIILAVSFSGEALNWLLPFPIPGSIYGMVILFVALMTGVIRLSSVKNVGDFLIDILPLLFIPPTVGLLDAWPGMQSFLGAIIVISIISTIIVAVVSGRITQYFLRHKDNLKDEGTALKFSLLRDCPQPRRILGRNACKEAFQTSGIESVDGIYGIDNHCIDCLWC